MTNVLNLMMVILQDEAVTSSADEKFSLIKTFNDGGPVMWPLLAMSVVSVIIILERFWVLNQARINTGEFLTKIRQALLKDRDVRKAIAQCEQRKGPIASIMKAGLLKYGAPKEEVEKVIENAAIHELGRLEKRLPILSFNINTAPLIGFFGTVAGMIASFQVLATQALTNPSAVAEGISVALITTAGGLVVSIVTLPFHSYFVARIGRFVHEMETSSNILLETFDEMEHLED